MRQTENNLEDGSFELNHVDKYTKCNWSEHSK